MKRAEALLPGTDALPTATVEVTIHRAKSVCLGKYLVRFRDPQGVTFRRTFNDPNEAMAHFWKSADQLTTESRRT